jgi:hypothetical protein
LGSIWFRRDFGRRVGHAEVRLPRKYTRKQYKRQR